MGSPITFSGFNQIDFNTILNAIMQQESRPLAALQAKQTALQASDTAFGQLASRLDTLRTASDALSRSSSLTSYSASSTDTSALTVSASSSALAGRYDVKINELARAQITLSSSFADDTDTEIVASGGSLTIGGTQIDVTGPVTLRDLVSLINADSDGPATASIIATAPGQFRLVLTGKATGEANGFTVDNQLSGSTVAFIDVNDDQLSGDDEAENAVQATNASVLINGIAVESTGNTLTDGIPGVTLTLLQEDPTKTVVVSVNRDDDNLADRIQAFVDGYNNLVKFANDQATASGKGTAGAIGRDSLLRGLRTTLRQALTDAHGSGAYTRLAEIGLGFTRTGEMKLDRDAFTAAVETDAAAVQQLFADATTGAFGQINNIIDEYTDAGGYVSSARTQISGQISRIGNQVNNMTARLAIRRAALQREFVAADQAMTRLNSQKSSLSSFGSSLISSSF